MNPVVGAAATPIATGGMVRLQWITPTDGTYDHVVVMRKATNDIAGIHDPYATRVYVGPGMPCEDFELIVNRNPPMGEDRFKLALEATMPEWGQTYAYAFYACNEDETAVSAAVVRTVLMPNVPVLVKPDAITWLITYLTAYFKKQIALGNCQVPTRVSSVTVVRGPMAETVPLPALGLHLDGHDATGQVLGRRPGGQERGRQAGLAIRLELWCESAEMRHTLDRALEGGLMAAVIGLDELGVSVESLHGHHEESLDQKQLLYLAVYQLTCTVPTGITIHRPGNLIQDIQTTVIPSRAHVGD